MQQNSDTVSVIGDINKEDWDAKSSTGSILSIGQESVTSAVTHRTELLGIT